MLCGIGKLRAQREPTRPPGPGLLPETWTGVALIADGQYFGKWNFPVEVPAPDSDIAAWQAWEQTCKTFGGSNRLQASAEVILEADDKGRQVLAIAPGGGLATCVVEVGSGMLDASGALMRQVVLRVGDKGDVHVRHSALHEFHIVSLPGTTPASGTIVIQSCAVTGMFGGWRWGSDMKWEVRGCHFKDSQLPWVYGKPGEGQVVESCHFSNCFLPDSFLHLCRNCTFDGCVIGRPSMAKSEQFGDVTVTEAGAATRLLPRPPGVPEVKIIPGTAKSEFWMGWSNAMGKPGVACRMSSGKPVKPMLLSGGQESAEALARAVEKSVYRRLDAPERLAFHPDKLGVLYQGALRPGGTHEAITGRRVEWDQKTVPLAGTDVAGKPLEHKQTGKTKGLFSADYNWLVAVDEVGDGRPDIVRVCQRLSEGVALARELAQRAVGTKWQLDGPEKFVIRFESVAQMIWVDGEGAARGGSFIRPFREDGKIQVASWQGASATVTLAESMTTLELISEGKTWKGTFISREPSNDFSALSAGPALASTDADTKKDPAKSGDPKPPAEAAPVEMTAGTSGLKARTCRMNGLLVAVLPNGRTAGATSQMNAIALPDANRSEASLRFNQETGGQMEKSLEEVRKFHTVRQGAWPKGYAIEISFADKYSPKDGPSAAVACGLLLEGLYTNTTWDPAVAVTGDMNSDGSVQPVGGVPAKIRGAAAKQCRIVGIPAANERAVRDLLISEGPSTLVSINIFGMKEFSHARDLAVSNRAAGLVTALTEYDKIIKAAPTGPQLAAWIKLPGVVGQLRKVVAAAPHHLSAKLLLESAEARGPQSMSIAGSLEAIDFEAGDLMDAVKSSIGSMGLSGLKEDKLGDAVFRLSRIRGKMHPETRPLLDSIENFSKVVRGFLNNPPNSAAYANKAAEAIQAASNKVSLAERALKSKPEVVAELMRN